MTRTYNEELIFHDQISFDRAMDTYVKAIVHHELITWCGEECYLLKVELDVPGAGPLTLHLELRRADHAT